ncbi:DNA-dependent RNA polymerase auxiliary subunit epsilon family protein [Bacillaceae bacterium Marseille-Q3522]|nr:DNA-dependent RNA polymerase auxiliary subunit epsilon family protein [Bacillaceae bacterium Marseille-Q3522]
MLFKVFYQESTKEVAVREKTKTLYLDGESERDIRAKMGKFPYNIEFITPVTGAFLEYEKKKPDFKELEIE